MRRLLYPTGLTPVTLVVSLLTSLLIVAPASAQLGGRPAADWIPTLEAPARVAMMKIPEVVAALKIQPGQVIADVGAGSGVLSGPLAVATGATGVLYAADIDQALLAHIERRAQADGLPNITTVLSSFSDAKLPASVDLAFMNDVLHHVSDRATYVKNLAKYLKPGGRLAIIDYTPEGSPHRGQPELIVSEADTDGWLRAAGLTRSESVALFEDRYFVIYMKR